jgi:hypothetical protein
MVWAVKPWILLCSVTDRLTRVSMIALHSFHMTSDASGASSGFGNADKDQPADFLGDNACAEDLLDGIDQRKPAGGVWVLVAACFAKPVAEIFSSHARGASSFIEPETGDVVFNLIFRGNRVIDGKGGANLGNIISWEMGVFCGVYSAVKSSVTESRLRWEGRGGLVPIVFIPCLKVFVRFSRVVCGKGCCNGSPCLLGANLAVLLEAAFDRLVEATYGSFI